MLKGSEDDARAFVGMHGTDQAQNPVFIFDAGFKYNDHFIRLTDAVFPWEVGFHARDEVRAGDQFIF